MNWKLPNQLTVARIGLAIVFFVLLGLYQQGTEIGRWLLNLAFVIYIIAGITDVLDGYIARKYHLTSAFGRIADPFVDKLLVLGAFVMLTGANFAMKPGIVTQFEQDLPYFLTGRMLSGVQAWMVVAILARELIVSAVRGYSESQGVEFPATYAGKIKMLVQSVTICTVLYQMANVNDPAPAWAAVTKPILVWLATIVTVFSGVAYISKARKLLASGHDEKI